MFYYIVLLLVCDPHSLKEVKDNFICV